MAEFANVVSLFENTLDRPLERGELERNPLTAKDLHLLAVESRKPYNEKFVPERVDEFEIRPFIDPEFNMGVMDYAIKGNLSSNFDTFIFDNSISGRMTSSIKRLLLYSHAVIINDPLDYILDFFLDDGENGLPPYILGRVDAANSLLKELADMADLIRNKILITAPFTVMNGGNAPYLNEASLESIVTALDGKVSAKNVNRYQYIVRALIARHNSFDGAADYFFPEAEYVHVLIEILRSLEREFISEQMTFQLNASLLARLDTINVDSLGIQEIINIRKNDETFDSWRDFLGEALKETANNQKMASSVNAEFNAVVRRELESKNNEAIRRIVESRWGRGLGASLVDISIGAITGTIPAAIIGNDGGAGALSGASKDVFNGVCKLLKSMRSRKANSALRSHFVTLGVKR